MGDRNATSLLTSALPWTGRGGHLVGVYPAIVTDNQDPDGLGRVRLRLPWAADPGEGYETWARVATFMTGARRGSWFIPEPDDEVLVAFEAGDARRPYVLGALWNGVDAPPESMAAGNNIRSLTSRSGIKVTMDDTDGGVQLVIETPGGQKVTLTDAPPAVLLEDSAGNSVRLEGSGVTITAASKLTLNANTVEVSAGMVIVNAGMSKFSGVVQSDTNITNSTISTSYTPGAGNIW
ncbi:MAG: type IV secretion protein Rhs [Chloroflexi bacterium]|nr:type IV secretion protein Rhs [Chloroflexota bacterium]